MVTLTLIQGVLNTFVLFFSRIIGHLVDRVLLKNERGYGIGYWVTTIIAQILLSILASMIVMWFSRKREYRADAAGASLASAPAMIGALQRLRSEQGMPNELPGELTAFGISEHLKQGASRLFMSHPPLEERIRALQST
jgi:heat shock protein HtpX